MQNYSGRILSRNEEYRKYSVITYKNVTKGNIIRKYCSIDRFQIKEYEVK